MSLLGGEGGLAGDIWSTGAFDFESPLKDLLDSQDYTIEQLMAEDELLQEIRGMHPVLIEYLSKEESLTKLIHYITLPPQPPPPPETSDEATNEASASTENTMEHPLQQVTERNNGQGNSLNGAQRVDRQLEKRKSGEKTKSPEADPEFRHVRFPYMACEIICCEVDGIIDTLVDGMVQKKDPGQIVSSSEAGDDVEVVQQPSAAFGRVFRSFV